MDTLLKYAIVFLCLVSSSGCSPNLTPLLAEQQVSGRSSAAVGEAAGVRILIDLDAWSGDPITLSRVLTPVLTTIENRSAMPLQVRLENFFFLQPRGYRFAAIKPVAIEGEMVQPIYPNFWARGEQVSPPYPPFPDASLTSHPWDVEDRHSDYDLWVRPLPTQSMVAAALQEGVLNPGQRTSGFLYFENFHHDRKITFIASFNAPANGAPLATITIPFTGR